MVSSNTETGVAVTYEDGDGTLDFVLAAAQPTITSLGTLTTLTVDDITINGSTISDAGNFTLDVEGDINFDANGSDITLLDGGTEFGRFKQVSNGMRIATTASDADMTFYGNDGGSEFTALTLDMSDAGKAIFNEGIKLSGLNGGTGLAFDMAGSGDYVIKESSTNDVMSFQGQLFHNFSSGNIGIGTASPSAPLHVKRDASETALAIQSNVGGSGSAVGGRLRLQLGAQSNSGSGNADTQAGDVLGQIMFEGQGTDYSYQGGNIKTIVTTGDGDDGRSNQATAMTFETIAVGSVSPTERMRIQSGGGISFNGDTAAANALDDYEEGVYAPTPSISGATGAIAFYANYNRLSYTKIGNQAHINGVLRVESNSVNGGRLNLTLPFTSLNGDEGEGQALFQVQIAAGSGSQASGYFAPVSENSTTLQVQTYTGVGSSNDSAVTMAVNSYLFISGTYTTV